MVPESSALSGFPCENSYEVDRRKDSMVSRAWRATPSFFLSEHYHEAGRIEASVVSGPVLAPEHSMTLPLHRVLSTNRIPESSRSQDDASLGFKVNNTEEENIRLHMHDSTASTPSPWLLMNQGNRERSAVSFKAVEEPHGRAGDNGFSYKSRTTDDDKSPDIVSLKSPFVASQKEKHFWIRRSEVFSLRVPGSFLSSFHSLFSRLSNRGSCAVPLGKCIMLCIVSIFVLISVLSSGRPGYSSSSASKADVSRTYRRFHREISPDLSNGGIFRMGTIRAKELGLCSREMEDRVPCYNVSASRRAGFKNGEEYDRHCGLTGRETRCLIRPPKQYRIPLKWPACRRRIWNGNVKATKEQLLGTGTSKNRLMLVKENWIRFHPEDAVMEVYSRKIATMIGLGNDTSFNQAGVRRTVLDIGCGFGSFGVHLFWKKSLTLCLAPYETQGSQVQFSLERGLPAMIGTLTTRQLPYSRSSFDMIHCSDCGVDWSLKDGLFVLEVDRLLKPGGYFIWTSPPAKPGDGLHKDKDQRKLKTIESFAKRICWTLLSQRQQTVIWRKTAKHTCYTSRGSNFRPNVCNNSQDADGHLYQPLQSCIMGAPTGKQVSGLSQLIELPHEAAIINGLYNEELVDDSGTWAATVKNYWSLFTPSIFSDHPKRPSDDDPHPPLNMVRNVMDMNAAFGSLNAALLQAGKSVWVMNVVPTSGPNTLPAIFNRGFLGTLHDWCEAFPTYPRTYDLLHAIGLLSQELERPNGCSLSKLFLEMDRILRPDGWVFLRDKLQLIEDARLAAVQMRWEARTIEVEGDNELRLLVCQKNFLRK